MTLKSLVIHKSNTADNCKFSMTLWPEVFIALDNFVCSYYYAIITFSLFCLHSVNVSNLAGTCVVDELNAMSKTFLVSNRNNQERPKSRT